MYLSVSGAEAAALLTLPGAELTKTRRILSHQGQPVAVDAFHGHLDGLILAEVDLGEDRPMPETLRSACGGRDRGRTLHGRSPRPDQRGGSPPDARRLRGWLSAYQPDPARESAR